MKCNFIVGQRVVCIDDEWGEWALVQRTSIMLPGPSRVPMLNEVLTIRDIEPVVSPIIPINVGAVSLFFHEISCGWSHTHFRTLIERKTDISVFTKILKSAPVEVVDA